MEIKTKITLYRTPLVAIMIVSFLASVYAALQGIEGVDWTSPIVIGTALVLYFIGGYIQRKEE